MRWRSLLYRVTHTLGVMLLGMAALPALAANPAFDCSRAGGTVERLVCADAGLAALDRKLSSVFARAMKNLPPPGKKNQRTLQRGWIKGRNECWKAEAVRTCVESEYATRITELQIIGGLVEVPAYVGYVCNADPRRPFTATFYGNTELPSAVLTYGSDQVIAYRAMSGSGARYAGRNVSFWEHQGEAAVEWMGAKFSCKPSSPAGAATVQAPGAAAAAARIPPEALRNLTYRGIDGERRPLPFKDGRWEGPPAIPGGATYPQANLIESLVAHGDLDGDGVSDAVVLINFSGGGTGQFLHVAAVKRVGATVRNVATRLVGDRVQIRDLRVEGRQIVLDVVRAGPNDPGCCAGELATLAWTLEKNALRPAARPEQPARLTPDALAGNQWVLRKWNSNESAAAEPEVTLAYADGKFAGQAGCNRYSAAVSARGEFAGDLAMGPALTTRMACPGDAMTLEARFLAALAGVERFWFHAGQLALAYRQGEASGVLFFARR